MEGGREPVVLGRIVGAHGLRGQLRVRYFGDGPDDLLALPRLRVGATAEDAEAIEYEVTSAAEGRRGEVRLAFLGVASREAAQALRGNLVMADRGALPELPTGEYYGYELIGCRVFGDDGRAVGTVSGIWSTGGPDLLVVEGEDGTEHLIPAAGELLREVDPEGRRIVIEVIPGLLDAK